MNKKGFLFTVFLLLFFLSLVILLFAYKDWYGGFQDSSQGVSQASTVAYVYDDISQDFVQLNDLKDVAIVRRGRNVSVEMLGGFNSSKNYSALLQRYEMAIENNYSHLVNMNISLDSVAYGFSIPEYKVSTSVDNIGDGVDSEYFIFADTFENLSEINVTLFVRNNTGFQSSDGPSGSNSDTQTLVRVTILDSSGNNQVLKTSKVLDGDDNNDNFIARFSNGRTVKVEYGRISGRDGTLRFQYEYNISILALDLTFRDFNQTIHVNFNGSSIIIPQVQGVSQMQVIGLEG